MRDDPIPPIGPTPPDPGARVCIPCIVVGASVLGVLLPERPPLERLAAFLLLACAALASAWRRRSRSHAPVQVGLTAASVLDSVNAAVKDGALRGGPYFGAARVAFHAHEALTVASIVVPPLVAGAVLVGGRRWRLLRTCVVVGALATLAVLVAGYPAVRELPVDARGEWLRQRYLAAEVASLFVTTAVAWRAGLFRLRQTSLAERTVACLLVGGLALLFVGAWGRGLFGPAFAVHQAGLAAMYGVVAAIHVQALRGDGRLGA